MANLALISVPTADPADLPALLRLLGYVSASPAEGGVHLRGVRNPDGSLRWVWPATLRKPLFLEFHNAGTLRACLFSLAVRLVFFCRLKSLFFQELTWIYAPIGAQSWPTANFALFTGTPGPNRKAAATKTHAASKCLPSCRWARWPPPGCRPKPPTCAPWASRRTLASKHLVCSRPGLPTELVQHQLGQYTVLNMFYENES